MGAVQGDLKKVDGDIWYADDVTAVLNVDASNFNDNMQNVFALDYIGFDSSLNFGNGPQFKNLFYNTSLAQIYLTKGLDEYNFDHSDGSSNYWTTEAAHSRERVEFGQEYVKVWCDGDSGSSSTYDAAALFNGASAPNIDDGGVYILDYSMDTREGSGTTNSAKISITDGTTTVAVKTASAGAANVIISRRLARMNVDKTNKTCTFSDDLTNETYNEISLAALNNGADWFLRIDTRGAYRDPIAYLYGFSQINTSEEEYIIDLGTTTSSVDNIFSVVNSISGGSSTVVSEFSSDGTNYYPITNVEILRLALTGTSLKLKFKLTSDGINIPFITEYAIKHSLY